MPNKKPKDNGEVISDKNDYMNEQIGGIRLELPLNRNLSWHLFGQLHNLLERNS